MTGPARPAWRSRLRATTAGSLLLKVVVFLVGALFIALGLVLIVLPGPLTIPPVLFGLWLWSTEFAWAERLRLRAAVRGRLALEAARQRPVHSAAATFGGLVLLVAGVLAVRRYDIVDRVIGSFG
ncbi:MAG: hypothetical protein QOJ79_225 [Actinomycetota bacterium]|jgi:hypothetical protein|nr:hypothetical protein [Actinomycetota bacterium]